MRNTIVIAVISLLIFSCNKDKFTTAPQLKYKSVNTTDVLPDELVQFKLSFTDAEGDLDDSAMYVEKVVTNCAAGSFKSTYKFPVASGAVLTSGEILVTYANGINIPGYENLSIAPRCPGVDDICYFRFVLKDKAKNKSDTVNSETITIHQ